MNVGTVYHWSPIERRDEILRDGLKLLSEPVVHSGEESFPYLCFSPDPLRAWRLSGDMGWTSEYEEWDLWLVSLVDGDEIHIQPEWGPEITEIRCRNSIPASRIHWVALREPLAGKKMKVTPRMIEQAVRELMMYVWPLGDQDPIKVSTKTGQRSRRERALLKKLRDLL